MSQASLRINESLDFETVLQGVLDSACSLTGARYGVIALVGRMRGGMEEFVTSGPDPGRSNGAFEDFPEGMLNLRIPSAQVSETSAAAGTSTATLRSHWACPSSARPFR